VVFQTFIIGRAVKRFGERGTALIGMGFGIASYIFIAFLTNGRIALLFNFFNGFSGMAMPAVNAMMSMRTPPNQQGELQGLTGSMSALAFLLAQLGYNNALAFFTSPVAPLYFPGAPFIMAACFGATALTALVLLPRRNDQLAAA
jgi:MFS transporter, DHA1 family, tetracycline resistance protein